MTTSLKKKISCSRCACRTHRRVLFMKQFKQLSWRLNHNVWGTSIDRKQKKWDPGREFSWGTWMFICSTKWMFICTTKWIENHNFTPSPAPAHHCSGGWEAKRSEKTRERRCDSMSFSQIFTSCDISDRFSWMQHENTSNYMSKG